MWQAAVEAGLLLLDFVYHRWIDPPPAPTLPPGQTIQIPITASGSTISMLFGRTRVTQPVLVFDCGPQAYTGQDPSGAFTYAINMTFALGFPFTNGVSYLWNMWAGDTRAEINAGVSDPTYPIPGHPVGGVGVNVATINSASSPGSGPYCCGPLLEFLDGNASQVLVDGSGVAQNQTGQMMLDWGTSFGITGSEIPGYRGVLLANCYAVHPNAWTIGPSPNAPSYSFEISTYPNASLGPNNGEIVDDSKPADPAYDANPIDVIYDILTGGYGKLGIDPALIDIASFTAAAITLYNEGHGYSNAIAGGQSAQQTIQDILKQIDATLYTNPSTNLITIKLIRPDYDPQTIPVITPDNCEALQNFSLGGWSDAPNKVRVTYIDRSISYKTNSALAIGGSNAIAFGQHEIVIQMPGVSNQKLAGQIAAREEAAQSRPIAKCTAIVNRSFYAVCPGDAVAVTWPEANIAGMVFRVAAVDRGTLKDGKISLDLIQDYFYQWRDNRPVLSGATGAFGGGRVATGG